MLTRRHLFGIYAVFAMLVALALWVSSHDAVAGGNAMTPAAEVGSNAAPERSSSRPLSEPRTPPSIEEMLASHGPGLSQAEVVPGAPEPVFTWTTESESELGARGYMFAALDWRKEPYHAWYYEMRGEEARYDEGARNFGAKAGKLPRQRVRDEHFDEVTGLWFADLRFTWQDYERVLAYWRGLAVLSGAARDDAARNLYRQALLAYRETWKRTQSAHYRERLWSEMSYMRFLGGAALDGVTVELEGARVPSPNEFRAMTSEPQRNCRRAESWEERWDLQLYFRQVVSGLPTNPGYKKDSNGLTVLPLEWAGPRFSQRKTDRFGNPYSETPQLSTGVWIYEVVEVAGPANGATVAWTGSAQALVDYWIVKAQLLNGHMLETILALELKNRESGREWYKLTREPSTCSTDVLTVELAVSFVVDYGRAFPHGLSPGGHYLYDTLSGYRGWVGSYADVGGQTGPAAPYDPVVLWVTPK